MSGESLQVLWTNPEQAKQSIAAQVAPYCRNVWEQGQRVAVTVQSEEEARSIQRNREYWGYVLRPISEQAQINGIGATAEGWHDYFRKMFLGYEFTKVKLPGMKRPSIRRQLKSTTKLSERKMREYCEQVRAHAANTFGVTFPALEERQ
jgi:hypothetical protein